MPQHSLMLALDKELLRNKVTSCNSLNVKQKQALSLFTKTVLQLIIDDVHVTSKFTSQFKGKAKTSPVPV